MDIRTSPARFWQALRIRHSVRLALLSNQAFAKFQT